MVRGCFAARVIPRRSSLRSSRMPELASVPTAAIHAPWKLVVAERRALCPDYPPPIVDHTERRPRAIAMYDRAKQQKK